jgi:hypothetical protein
METRELFREATYGPDALKLMCRAFDEAWESIAGNFGDDPRAVEIARTRPAAPFSVFRKTRSKTSSRLRTRPFRLWRSVTRAVPSSSRSITERDWFLLVLGCADHLSASVMAAANCSRKPQNTRRSASLDKRVNNA